MPLPTPIRAQGCVFILLAALSLSLSAQGQTTNPLFAARAARAFELAKTAWAAHPDDASSACHLGQTSYDWSLFATNAEQRAAVAQAGIAACRQWVTSHPQSAPGHYYLAMDYGELAEAEAPSLAAYKLIREIEHEFKTANELSNRLDYAGPPRCLGLLYRDAPGWPVSIGNRHKAREFLDQAAALAPDFPENQLNLVESHVRWHQAADAEKAWHKLSTLWPSARTNLTGVDWEVSWDDWTTRRAAAKAEYQKTFKKTLPP